MQKFSAIFLLVALCFQLFAKLSVVALYEVNKDYIAKQLCENRAKPKMHCNGKCYLKKQLKKVDDTEHKQNSGPESKSENTPLVVFIIPAVSQPAAGFSDPGVLQHYSNYRSIIGVNTLKDIFHPPQHSC